MKKYIPSLDGLRALSILIVIMYHILLKGWPGTEFSFPLSIIFHGSMGVNIFFVISGFLITRLLLQEEAESGTISLKNFYIRRAFRIFPAYYFLVLVLLALQLFSVLHLEARSWISTVFYFKYFSGFAYKDWETQHFWSLSVEEHFYLIWPLVFIFFKKFRVHFAVFIVAMVIVMRFNVYYTVLHNTTFTDSLTFFQRADGLMIGCLGALFEPRISAWIQKSRSILLNPLVLILALGFICSDVLPEWNLKHHLHLGFLLIPLGIGIKTSVGLVANVLIALLMFVSVYKPGAWFNFLNTKPMRYIGRLSYSLYLWQQVILSDHLAPINKFPLNVIVIFAMANFSYYVIEKPFLRLKDKMRVRRSAPATPAAQTDPAEPAVALS